MKKIALFLIASLFASVSAFAVTVTNTDGTVITTTLLSETAAAVRDTAIVQDQSKLPDQDNRTGYLSFLYNVANDGGTGSINIGPALPAGTAIKSGYAQVITAITPSTATNSFGLLNTTDLMSAGTTLQSTGLKPLNIASAAYVTSGSTATNTILSLKAPVVSTAASNQVLLTFTGSAATQGVVYVVLDLFKVQ